MGFGIYLFDDIGDDSVFINDKGSTSHAHLFSAVHDFLHPNTVSVGYSLLCIG
jgi:hypothetical protein